MLYLAQARLVTSRYMDDRQSSEPIIRLVEADTAEQAEAKLKAAIEVDDPYGTSVDCHDIDLSEVIR